MSVGPQTAKPEGGSPTPPPSTLAGGALAYARVRGGKRLAARTRIHRRVVRPIDSPGLLADPLARRSSRLLSTVTAARLLLAAVLIHALVIVAFFVLDRLRGERAPAESTERLTVRIIDVPEPEPEPEQRPSPVAPDFAPPKPPEPPKPPPKKARARRPKPVAVAPAEPPPAELPPVRRRIVGLSLESTVGGAAGPAFATGTSRMGRTARTAADPAVAAQVPSGESAGDAPGRGTAPVRQQRVASRIPTRDSVFVKPVRSQPSKPAYPPMLKAQGVEGAVLVRVDITAVGRVSKVVVLKTSGHTAFDEAARKAAMAERFTPAQRDGRPVPFTLSYHYRFRIEDN